MAEFKFLETTPSKTNWVEKEFQVELVLSDLIELAGAIGGDPGQKVPSYPAFIKFIGRQVSSSLNLPADLVIVDDLEGEG